MIAVNFSQPHIIIGLDVHSQLIRAIAKDEQFNTVYDRIVKQDRKDFEDFYQSVTLISENKTIFWGREASVYSTWIDNFLFKKGHDILNVDTKLVKKWRQGINVEKSDYIDCEAIVSAVRFESKKVRQLTLEFEDDYYKELRSLTRERLKLSYDIMRVKSELHHALFKSLSPKYKTFFKNKSMFGDAWIKEALEYFAPFDDMHSFLIIRKLKKLKVYEQDADDLDILLKKIANKEIKALCKIKGINLVLASGIVGEIGNIDRFETPDKLARWGGIAPLEDSSATDKDDKDKAPTHRLDLRGNGYFDHYVYHVSVTQTRDGKSGYAPAQKYFAKKGGLSKNKKTKKDTRRKHKRKLVNVIFRTIKQARLLPETKFSKRIRN